jgi:hypothetical protein
MKPWYDCCGGGSICTRKWTLGLKNQCRSYSCTIKTALSKRFGMGRESHMSLLSFACQRALSYRTQYVWRTTCKWAGPLNAHVHWCLGWPARGPWVLHREGWISGFDPLDRVGVGMRCAKKDGDWLGSMTGPHTKEVWTGTIARLCDMSPTYL